MASLIPPDFYQRRAAYFKDSTIEGSYKVRIQELKKKRAIQEAKNKMTALPDRPTVVILGAGPAGLMRAIQSIGNGNPTIVIEKRGEEADGRENTVAIMEETIKVLKYCGIYQYLTENRLIYPPNRGGYISVRLTDLQQAMKAVLHEIAPKKVIQYDSKVVAIDSSREKIRLTIEQKGKQKIHKNIDIIVNAEGSRSSTNTLLGNNRTEVLPRIPVIAAFYKDEREAIKDTKTFFAFSKTTVVYVAQTIARHIVFIFKIIFSSHFRAQIKGALILNTPGQSYVGCAFSDGINQRLLNYEKSIKGKKGEAREREKRAYRAYAKEWIDNATCAANLASFLLLFSSDQHHFLDMAGHRSFSHFNLIEIGADRADDSAYRFRQSFILMAGDACATVDPTTGLGCNTAIQSSTAFLDFLWDSNESKSPDDLIHDYKERIETIVSVIHKQSKQFRQRYRPDALHPAMLMQRN